jgi:hypothetical protein
VSRPQLGSGRIRTARTAGEQRSTNLTAAVLEGSDAIQLATNRLTAVSRRDREATRGLPYEMACAKVRLSAVALRAGSIWNRPLRATVGCDAAMVGSDRLTAVSLRDRVDMEYRPWWDDQVQGAAALPALL